MTSSKRSSQRQRDLELSTLKREKQHEAKLRIARQHLEIEKQTKLWELEFEQLEEDHRKEVAAAALEEIELMTKSSADGSGTGKMSGRFAERSSVKSKKLVQVWVNLSPAGNMADVANEPSLHFSGSIAQSNQAIVQRPSSAQLPNSHTNTNTHGQVEANINLTVHEPQEPSSRTNVTNDAHVVTNDPPHFPLIPPAFRFLPSPSQALPLHATNPVANNVNLLPHSPPAPFISSASVFVPQLFHPPPPQKSFQHQNFVPITHAPPAPPDPNVWRFTAAVPPNAVPLVRTSANLYTVQPAPIISPHITTSLRSTHVQAAAGPQNYVTSDFVQANPFSSSTGVAPIFVTPIIPPTYGATVPIPLCWGGPPHPTPSAPSLDSADLIKQLADAITCPLPEWKLTQYNGDPLQWYEWFGQFKSAIDSQSLSDDVKLTYIKTLVTGKAKTAIAEFAYCGVMYKDALKTLERKFGQPQVVVGAHLDKLGPFPPLKMHNSDNTINNLHYFQVLLES